MLCRRNVRLDKVKVTPRSNPDKAGVLRCARNRRQHQP